MVQEKETLVLLKRKCVYSFLVSGEFVVYNNFCKQFGPRSGPTKCWA